MPRTTPIIFPGMQQHSLFFVARTPEVMVGTSGTEASKRFAAKIALRSVVKQTQREIAGPALNMTRDFRA